MFKVTTAQQNHFQIAKVVTDHNPSIEIIFAEDHEIDKIHKIIDKIHIADQTVKIIKTFTLDQFKIEVFVQMIIGNVLIQTLGKETIPMNVEKTLQLIEIKTVQIVEIKIIRVIDHKTTPTIDHIIMIIIIDPVIFLKIETKTTETYQKTIFNHHIEIILNFQTHKIKTITQYTKTSKTI